MPWINYTQATTSQPSYLPVWITLAVVIVAILIMQYLLKEFPFADKKKR